MQHVGPIVGLLGAVVGSISSLKWMLAGFVIVMIGWVFMTQKTSKNALDARALKDLVKSSAQWKTRALQDTNALIGLMNANYAMAYLNVARSIGSDADIEKNTGAAIDELLKDIEGTQSNAIQRLSMSCPSVTPNGLAAVHTGWLSN